MTTVTPTSLLHEPGSAAYEDACTLFNSMIERRPRYVARCASPADVALSLSFASALGLPVAVRAGGHSVAGLSLCDGGVVLDVRGLDAVDVDAQRRIARVGGGVERRRVDEQAHPRRRERSRASTASFTNRSLSRAMSASPESKRPKIWLGSAGGVGSPRSRSTIRRTYSAKEIPSSPARSLARR